MAERARGAPVGVCAHQAPAGALRRGETGRSAQFPAALSDVGPRDALVTIQEQSNRTPVRLFASRPARFGPSTGTALTEATACSPATPSTKSWMSFSDRGRNFYALVAVGPQASAATRAAAFRILDGLRVAARP